MLNITQCNGHHLAFTRMCLWWDEAVRPRTRIRARRLLIIVGLIAWLLWVPVVIAFGGCVGMGATCHSPCVLTSYELPTVPGLVALQVIEPLHAESPTYLPTPSLKVPTPPPRFALFSSSFSVML
jgi:hypothetical protein